MTADHPGQAGKRHAPGVVLVGADTSLRRGLAQALRGRGLGLYAAATAGEGVELALSTRPDAVVLGAGLADAVAIGLLRALRREPALDAVPVIVLSAGADAATRMLGLRAGANEVVATPCDAAELAERIQAQRAAVDRIRGGERRLLAREVHDRLGQLLTAANIDLCLLDKRAQDGAGLPPREELLRELGSARSAIGRAIASVQDIALLLRPPALDAGGLAAALHREVDDFRRRARLDCTLLHDEAGYVEPPPSVAGELLRICQEALANALRHADASHVRVQLAVRGGNLLLRVCDDGVGIPRGAADAPAAIGIAGMRERAHGIRASLHIRGRPGCGTILSVRYRMSGLRNRGGPGVGI